MKRSRFKHRKNFLPALLFGLAFWLWWGWFVFKITPDSTLAFTGFYLSLFLAFFITWSLILVNTRRGFFTGLFLILVLLFRHLQIGNLLNLLLLAGIFSAIIFYTKA